MEFADSLAEAASINDNIDLWWLWHFYVRGLRQESDPWWWVNWLSSSAPLAGSVEGDK